jgi:hypothetical protein
MTTTTTTSTTTTTTHSLLCTCVRAGIKPGTMLGDKKFTPLSTQNKCISQNFIYFITLDS